MSFDEINMGDLGRDIQAKQPKPRGWWSRNWLWFVPTLLVCMMIICCGGPVAIFFGVVGVLRNTEPYLTTMEKIQADKQAQEAFGQPIRDNSWVPAGQIEINNDRGNAELRWDLAGPKGNGKAYVKARMTDGKWEIVIIEVTLPDGKKLLLHEEGAGNEAPAFIPPSAAEGEKKEEAAPQFDLTPNIPMPEETEPKK